MIFLSLSQGDGSGGGSIVGSEFSVFRFADQSDNGSFGIYLFRVKNNAEGHSK